MCKVIDMGTGSLDSRVVVLRGNTHGLMGMIGSVQRSATMTIMSFYVLAWQRQ